MTIPAGMGEAALRALVLGVLLAWLARYVVAAARRWPWLWVALALPALTPSVVVGYGYVYWSPGSTGSVALELFYDVLLAGRFLPVAALVLFVLPAPALTPRGEHGLTLLGRLGLRDRMSGRFRNPLVVGAVVFLFVFQEFELASLFYGVRTWTVSTFDAHVGGLSLGGTLDLVAVPVLLELVVLGFAFGVFRASHAPMSVPVEQQGAAAAWPGAVTAAAATAVLCLVPMGFLVPALGGVVEQVQMQEDLRHSVVFAVGATLCSSVLASALPVSWLCVLAVPGLSGGLALGLLLLALFQTPAMAALYDTPLVLLLALTLLLLPFALVLRLAGERWTERRALHTAELLRGADDATLRRRGASLAFRLRGLRIAVSAWLLFLVAFFEVVASHLLAPGDMSPAAPRLYNMMHYGRMPGLAAMVLWMAATGLICGVVGIAVYRVATQLVPVRSSR